MDERSVNPEAISATGERIFANYSLSYPHGQGDRRLQIFLLLHFTQQYPPGAVPPVTNLREAFDARVNAMTLPKHHTSTQPKEYAKTMPAIWEKITDDDIKFEANLYWNTQMDLINALHYEKPSARLQKLLTERMIPLDIDPESLLINIASHMIDRDIRFVKKGRQFGTDPFASFVKTNALDGLLIYPADYRNLYRGVARVIQTDDDLKNGIAILAPLWEEKHPGRTFFPQEA